MHKPIFTDSTVLTPNPCGTDRTCAVRNSGYECLYNLSSSKDNSGTSKMFE